MSANNQTIKAMKKSYQKPCVIKTQLMTGVTILNESPIGYGDEMPGGVGGG